MRYVCKTRRLIASWNGLRLYSLPDKDLRYLERRMMTHALDWKDEGWVLVRNTRRMRKILRAATERRRAEFKDVNVELLLDSEADVDGVVIPTALVLA